MAPKLGLEARMTIAELSRRGWSRCQVARALGVTEGAVRYHLRRRAAGARDGRADQPHVAQAWQPAIEGWLESRGADAPLNLAALHAWLVEEHGYAGSVRSLQRYFRVRYPRPARRARRRIETPPGAQGQADWGEFPRVRVGSEEVALHAFHLALSHSRHEAIVWSAREDQVSWLSAHNGSFRRLGGVPAVVRVDNVKTAIVQGAGAWGQINETYRRYAQAVRFHVDACAPYDRRPRGRSSVASAISASGSTRPSRRGGISTSCRPGRTRASSARRAGGSARPRGPACGRHGRRSDRIWVRCRCCRSRSTWWSRGK
jgi:transposase